MPPPPLPPLCSLAGICAHRRAPDEACALALSCVYALVPRLCCKGPPPRPPLTRRRRSSLPRLWVQVWADSSGNRSSSARPCPRARVWVDSAGKGGGSAVGVGTGGRARRRWCSVDGSGREEGKLFFFFYENRSGLSNISGQSRSGRLQELFPTVTPRLSNPLPFHYHPHSRPCRLQPAPAPFTALMPLRPRPHGCGE